MTRSRYRRSSRNWPAATRSSRLRLVAATTRTSTGACGRSEPTAWISPFSRNRNSHACMRRIMSPTSSRNSVPRCASRSLPRFSGQAPVMFPSTCPKSSDSRRASVRPAQFTATNGASLRLDWLWIYRATRSLPTPLSPVIRTVAGLFAARLGHGEQFRHGTAGDDEACLLQRSTRHRDGDLDEVGRMFFR